MDNPLYNSLTEKLIQDGILSSTDFFYQEDDSKNFFKFEKKEEENQTKTKKRLNQYDLDLIGDSEIITNPENKPYESIKRFLNFKKIKLENGNATLYEIIFSKFFPKIYKAKLVKQAMSKFIELNIDTQTLLNKTIPYGENETRYKDLIKYLNYANELQTKLKKNI